MDKLGGKTSTKLLPSSDGHKASLDVQEATTYLHETGILHAYRGFLEETFAHGLPTLARRHLFDAGAKSMLQFRDEHSGAITSRSLGKKQLFDENFQRGKLDSLRKSGPVMPQGSRIWHEYDSQDEDEELDRILTKLESLNTSSRKKKAPKHTPIVTMPQPPGADQSITSAVLSNLGEKFGRSASIASLPKDGRHSDEFLQQVEAELAQEYRLKTLRLGWATLKSQVTVMKEHVKLKTARDKAFYASNASEAGHENMTEEEKLAAETLLGPATVVPEESN